MELPEVLYKYRSFDTNCLVLIERLKFYYANPRNFNDPFDCDPAIGEFSSIEDGKNVLYTFFKNDEAAAKKLISEIKHQLAHPDYNKHSKSELRTAFRSSILFEIRKHLLEYFSSFGVLSLSSSWNNMLLWSHYAQNHTGICIGYKTNEHMCNNLDCVDYTMPRTIEFNSIKKWRLENDEKAELEILKRFFYGKSRDWDYEQEWRDVREPTRHGATGVGLHDAPLEIGEIIFGTRCSFSVIATVVRLYEVKRADVKFFHIVTSGSAFDLRREELDVDEVLSGSPQIPLIEIVRGFDNVLNNDH